MMLVNLIKFSTHLIKRQLIGYKVINRCKSLTTFSYMKNELNRKQNLVIDLSFEDLMTSEECHRLAVDLYTIHSINSSLPEDQQFNVSLCQQLSKNSLIIEYLSHYLPKLEALDNFHIHNESYIDLFDARRLVYLSSDARDLIEYNSNDIYIIGGLVKKKIFKRESNRVTHSKAKREGLRVARLPIDHLINSNMKRGIVLFVPQVFSILNDIKSGHNWETAAQRNIPCWKLKPFIVSHHPNDTIIENVRNGGLLLKQSER